MQYVTGGKRDRRARRPEGGRPVRVIVDDRETRGPVPAALRAGGGFDVSVRRLAVGDYLVDGPFLFERKTLDDLVASIATGRLFGQALRLAGVRNGRPALVLEGRAADLRGTGMRRQSIQGALITVSLFIGLPILRSKDAGETADLFRYAALQGQAVATGALKRPGRRVRGKRALQMRLLQGVPGVGPERAKRLIERFGSVQAVFNANNNELAEVEGIGSRIADLIAWSVREPGAGYGVGCEMGSG